MKMQFKFFRDKKAQEELYNAITQILIVIFLLISLLLFVYANVNSSYYKERVLAKELATLIDASQPDTTIQFNSQYPVDIKEQNVTVGGSIIKSVYSFFTTSKVTIEETGKKPEGKIQLLMYKITVSKK